MVDEAEQPKKPIAEAIREALQTVFNDYPMEDHGPAFVGDYILVTEQITGDKVVLRIIDSDDLSPWKRTGMLQWTVNDDVAEAAGGYAWSLSFPPGGDVSGEGV